MPSQQKHDPDVMLDLPPSESATAASLRDAFIVTAKVMIAAGYDPARLARALIGTGASLALDLAGKEWSLAELHRVVDEVSDLSAASPLDVPPQGRG